MKHILFCILFFGIVLSSCNMAIKKPDISKSNINVSVIRFDKDFFVLNEQNFYAELPFFQKKYPDFFTFYNEVIIKIGNPDEASYFENYKKFVQYYKENEIDTKVAGVFADTSKLNADFTLAFKYYNFYFPDKKVPEIYTCISGFQESVFPSDNLLAISLDKYLGSAFNATYTSLGFDVYKQRRMIPEMIPVDCMRAMGALDFPFNDSVNNMLCTMIYEGRLQYYMDAVLPDVADTLKWSYTASQFDWAKQWESKIWDYLIENKMLFSTNMLEIKSFTGEAPFTTVFSNNSAPRAASYIGYQIVKSYVKNNPDINLDQLMQITDYMEIYNSSDYNP